MSRKLRDIFTDTAFIIAGAAITALAIDIFVEPGRISPGGLTGLATVLHAVIGLPTGLSLVLMNIPLVIIAARRTGRGFLIKTVAATLLLSLAVDLFAVIAPEYHGNRLLAALYGGGFSGFGLALVLLRGGTTGGTDIIAKLINDRRPYISVGRVLLVADAVVCLLAAAAYRDVETALYSAVSIFVSARVLDTTLYSGERGKMFYIFSRHSKQLSATILERLGRGVTLLASRGGYSGQSGEVILCAVRAYQSGELRQIVRESDSDAFVVVASADEIIGEGFDK